MSLGVNPVLGGTFGASGQTPDYSSASATISATGTQALDTAAATNDVTGPDPRRYTKFDHSDTEAGTTTLSFGDVLDMINPLEHIPVISSIYRAATGESINPVSRVVGDIFYGGVLSAPSAIIGGINAIANASFENQTGKDSSGLALAALFGPDDKPATTQLADAVNTAPTTTPLMSKSAAPATAQLASASSSVPSIRNFELAQSVNTAPMQAALQVQTDNAPAAAPSTATAAQTNNPAVASAAASAQTANTQASQTAPGGGIPLAKSFPINKQPFGGVPNQPNMQAQDMAIALSESSPTMRMGHTIYTNRLVNGPHPLPPMLSSSSAQGRLPPVVAPPPVVPPPATVPVSDAGNKAAATLVASATQFSGPAAGALTSALQSAPRQNQMPPGFAQDMMMKAMLNRYGTSGGSSAGAGSMFDLTN